ncbi:MAG: DUF1549 domain-containing protein [Anaeromyxobacter sp.]
MNTNFDMDVVADQIDVIGRGVMGLSVACARCHDHKFDPIPTRNYYALAGFFTSTEPLWGIAGNEGADRPSDGPSRSEVTCRRSTAEGLCRNSRHAGVEHR